MPSSWILRVIVFRPMPSRFAASMRRPPVRASARAMSTRSNWRASASSTPVSPLARRRSTSSPSAATQSAGSLPASDWVAALEQEVERRLARGETGVLDQLSRQFERSLIAKALARTGGRRIEAANLLGMGRNTITRKIQELGIEEDAGE